MEKIKVFAVDEHILFRQGVRASIGSEPDIDWIGEAADGEEAFETISALSPDVVLTDVKLPSMDGLELTRKIRLRSPGVGVVIMSAQEDEELLFQAIKVGAAAYYTKSVRPEELLSGIRRVAQGEYLINESVLTRPLVASRVLKQFRDLSLIEHEIEPLFAPLSSREMEILDYIARGNSNKEIARALKISDQTVKNHITSILRKLAVNDRTQAVVFALRRGWIKVD
ncbi:MAG: response regulator transcription factor [Chloroflexota bacterium]|nr:MAG: response regulator transcription factor [Chloroflexota bacterium]